MTIVSTQEAADSILSFVRQRSPAASEILSSDTPLLEGVLDSLGVVELVAFLTETYGIEITDEDLVPLNFETIGHAVNFLERKWTLERRCCLTSVSNNVSPSEFDRCPNTSS